MPNTPDNGGGEIEPEALARRIEGELTRLGLDSLLAVADENLLDQDTVQASRLTYVVSLLRMLAYLRAQPAGFKQQGEQAALALAYVKHVENTNMKALQLGRHEEDRRLALEVGKMRAQMAEVSRYKQKFPEKPILDMKVLPSGDD